MKTITRSDLTNQSMHQANDEFTNVPAGTLLEIYSLLFIFMFLVVFVL